MASYSITLNLRGTAVKNSKTLADNLERADKAAKSLKSTLQGMPNVPTGGRGGFGGVGGGRPTYGSSIGNGLVSAVTSFSSQSGLGTVFRFAGKLNTALALTDVIFRASAQAVKIGTKFNIMAFTGGAQLLNKGAQILTSAQMGEGIRLLQRRQQARLGFGAGHAEAQERADLLAASYGLDPSNAIASMNVLAGMRVGNKKITTAQAERLTQVGGLIAQQSGMSFETVMINIQQMMAQAVPSMRDIRQLLTHAPILGRYALDEMEKKGITGMSAMEYLKANKGAMMTVFERYLAENPALLSMRARGVAQRAKTGFYATLSENDTWLGIADKFAEVSGVTAESFSKILTTLAESDAIRTSVNSFIALMEDAPDLISKVVGGLDKFIIKLQDLSEWIPWLGGKVEKGQIRSESEKVVEAYIRKNLTDFGGYAEGLGMLNRSDEELVQTILSTLRGGGKNLADYVTTVAYNPNLTEHSSVSHSPLLHHRGGRKVKVPFDKQQSRFASRNSFDPTAFTFSSVIDTQLGGFINESLIHDRLMAASRLSADLYGLNGGGDGTVAGEDISGYGRDRKALVINFNDAIVKWDSTIQADDPQDVVNTVSQTIEDAASRAIGIALRGATSKMGDRF